MSTGQSYLGKGDSTTSTEPTAAPNPQAAKSGPKPSQPADNRSFDADSPEGNLTAIQADILELVNHYTDLKSPVPFLNELVRAWINDPYTHLDNAETKANLRQMLHLSSFLVELAQAGQSHRYFANRLREGQRHV